MLRFDELSAKYLMMSLACLHLCTGIARGKTSCGGSAQALSVESADSSASLLLKLAMSLLGLIMIVSIRCCCHQFRQSDGAGFGRNLLLSKADAMEM